MIWRGLLMRVVDFEVSKLSGSSVTFRNGILYRGWPFGFVRGMGCSSLIGHALIERRIRAAYRLINLSQRLGSPPAPHRQ